MILFGGHIWQLFMYDLSSACIWKLCKTVSSDTIWTLFHRLHMYVSSDILSGCCIWEFCLHYWSVYSDWESFM